MPTSTCWSTAETAACNKSDVFRAPAWTPNPSSERKSTVLPPNLNSKVSFAAIAPSDTPVWQVVGLASRGKSSNGPNGAPFGPNLKLYWAQSSIGRKAGPIGPNKAAPGGPGGREARGKPNRQLATPVMSCHCAANRRMEVPIAMVTSTAASPGGRHRSFNWKSTSPSGKARR